MFVTTTTRRAREMSALQRSLSDLYHTPLQESAFYSHVPYFPVRVWGRVRCYYTHEPTCTGGKKEMDVLEAIQQKATKTMKVLEHLSGEEGLGELLTGCSAQGRRGSGGISATSINT